MMKLRLRMILHKHRTFATVLNEQNQVGKRKKKGIWPWSRQPEEEAPKILRPGNCEEEDVLLNPKCKVAIIVNGAKNIGLSAARSLLRHGAKNVIMAHDNQSDGQNAVQRLCDMHGRERAQFALCGLNTTCKFEALFESALCRQKNIQILVNNLEGIAGQPCNDVHEDDSDWSKTRRAIEVGVKFMGRHNGGAGGIIISTAKILGFMGWPEEPTPVYCTKEPVVETTQDLAKIYPFEKTGVRITTLLESSGPFEEIGLPDIPQESKPQIGTTYHGTCAAMMDSKIQTAIIHLMAKAQTGSTWLVESPSLRDLPRLIHFPKEGEKIDGNIYQEVVCPPAFAYCASVKKLKCSPEMDQHCTPHKTKK